MVLRRTFRIELHDLEVHIGVCDYDVQLLFEGKEIGGHAFEVVFATAEEQHFVGFFLLWLLVLSFAYSIYNKTRRTVYPVNQTPLYASPINSMPVFGNDFSVVT